jgi:putative inorganic carbon (hco3(-)) transporter
VAPLTRHFQVTFTRSWPPIWLLLAALLLGLALSRLPLSTSLVLLLATAVFLLVAIEPLAGILLALLAGPFGALERIALGNVTLDSGQFFLLLALASWMARGLRQRRIAMPAVPLNGPLFLFIGVAAVTVVGSPSPVLGLKELLKWLEIAAIVWLVVDRAAAWRLAAARPRPPAGTATEARITGRDITPYLLFGLLFAGLVQAAVGVWQFAWRGDGPEHFLILGRFYRAYGTFEQPNPFGGYMGLNAALALGVLLGLLRHYGLPRRLTPSAWRLAPGARLSSSALWLLFVAVCAGLTSLALLFSWSRGAWLALAAAVVTLVLFWPRRLWLGAGLVGLVVAGLWLSLSFNWLPASVGDRLASLGRDFQPGDVRGVAINDANYAVVERLAFWQAAVGMAEDHFWWGVGFGNYEAAYPAYALINWPLALGHAHNYYLNLLAETGMLGSVAYLIFWAAVFRQTICALRAHEWPRRGIALGLLAAWVYLSVHHLVDKLYVNNIYIHLGVMLALLQLLILEAREDKSKLSAARMAAES